jgi:hypothetical protein
MMLTKKAKTRLLKLAEFMERLPKEDREHFNMGVWFMHAGAGHGHGVSPGQVVGKKEITKCGTSACALGWATTIPAFRRAGLKLIATEGIGRVSAWPL